MLRTMLVPRFLRLSDVAFPLEVNAQGVRIALAVPALEPLQLVLAALCNPGVPAEQRACFAQGRDFVAPELAAVRTSAGHPDARQGAASWRELARSAAALNTAPEIYLFTAGFSRHALAVPRPIAAALCAELVALAEGLRRGEVRAELAPPTDDDPRLAGGPMEETVDDEWDDEPLDDEPLGQPPPEPSRQHGAPAALASDEVLRELEAAAAMLDQLDPEQTLRAGLPPEELDALTAARRQTLLLGLRAAGLLAAAADEPAARRRLAEAGMLTLLGYLDAAAALRDYLRSTARARLTRSPASDDVLGAAVSLDYFRLGSPPGPENVTAHEWLALCEANLLHARPAGPRATRTFVRLEGRGVWLCARAEIGPEPKLWRVAPATR